MPPATATATVSLRELADLAIGTPEVGAVNFTALHTLIVAMLRSLNLQEVRINFQSPSPSELPRTVLSAPQLAVPKEKPRSSSARPPALESQVKDLSKQLKTVTSQVQGIMSHVQHLTYPVGRLPVDSQDWLEEEMAVLLPDRARGGLMKIGKDGEQDGERASVTKATVLLHDVAEDVKALKEAKEKAQEHSEKAFQRMDELEKIIRERDKFLDLVGRKLSLMPVGEEVTMVTWEELEQAITDGWRASQAGSETTTGLLKRKKHTSLTSDDGASTKHSSADPTVDSANGHGSDRTLSGISATGYPSEGVGRERKKSTPTTAPPGREQHPRARDEAGLAKSHHPSVSQFRLESDRHRTRELQPHTSAYLRKDERESLPGLVQQDLPSATAIRDQPPHVYPDQHGGVHVSYGQIYPRPDQHGIAPLGMDQFASLDHSTYPHSVVPLSMGQLGMMPPGMDEQGSVLPGMDQRGMMPPLVPGRDQQGLQLPSTDQPGMVPFSPYQHGMIFPGTDQQPDVAQRGLIPLHMDQHGFLMSGMDQHGLVPHLIDQHGLGPTGTDQNALVQPGLVQPGAGQPGLVQPGMDQRGLVQPVVDERGLVQPGAYLPDWVQPGAYSTGWVQPGAYPLDLVYPDIYPSGLVQLGADQPGLMQPGLGQQDSVQPGTDQYDLGQPGMDQRGLVQLGMDQRGLVQPGIVQPGLVQPGAAQPGSVQPGAAQPGLVQPGAAQPGLVQPGAAQPGLVQPGAAQPGLVQPGAAQPGLVQPGAGQRGLVQPGAGQPGLVQPGAAQPGLVQPGAAQPGLVQPGAAQPGLVQPRAGQPGLVQPRAGQPGLVQPGAAQPGLVQPRAGQPGLVQPGAAQPGLVQPGAAQPGLVQPGAGQPGLVQPGAAQPGLVQPGAAQPGLVQPRAGQPGLVQPGAAQPGLVQPRAGQPGLVQPGAAQPGLVQPGAAQPGLVQPGAGQHGLVQPGMDLGGLVPPGMGQRGLAQPGSAQPGLVQPGAAQPGLVQPGAAQLGLVQPGVAQPGLVQPGAGQRGLVRPGAGQRGLVRPGAGQRGLVQPGAAQPGLVQPGAGQPGLVQPGAAQPGLVQPGAGRPGLVQPGAAQPGLVQPGAGQAGQPGLVQPGAGQPSLVQPGMDLGGLVQPGMDQRVLAQPGAAQPGLVPPGAGQPGVVQPGIDQRGLAQPGSAQPGLVQPAMSQYGLAQPDARQPGLVQSGVSQPGLVQPQMGQPALVQPGAGQPGLVQPGMDQRGLVYPGADQGGLVQPGAGQPDLVQPGAGQLGLVQRGVGQRGLVEPGTGPRGVFQPGAYPPGLLQPGAYLPGLVPPGALPRGFMQPLTDQRGLRQPGRDQQGSIPSSTELRGFPTFHPESLRFISPHPYQHGVMPPSRGQHGRVSPLLSGQGLAPPGTDQEGLSETYQPGVIHPGTDQGGQIKPDADQHDQSYSIPESRDLTYPGPRGPGFPGVDQLQISVDPQQTYTSDRAGISVQTTPSQEATFAKSTVFLNDLYRVSSERVDIQSERRDSLDKLSPSFPIAVETFRLMGELIGLYVELKENMKELDEEKAGQTDLEKLQYLLSLMVKKTIPPDVQEQLKTLKALTKEVRQERAKLDKIQRLLEGEREQEIGKEMKDDQLSTQLGILRVTVADIEKELAELRESQERGKVSMEHSVSEASLYLQDQLDKLRTIIESMLASSSTLLSMSMTPRKILTASAPSQIDPETTCPACSLDLGHQVSMLVQRYEQLQDMVTNLAATRPSKKAKLQSQDEELLGHIQSAILQVQGDCEKLNITTGSLIEDHRQKQKDIDVLYQGLEKLEKEKANREHLEMEIDVKADKSALEAKVSRVQFDATTEQLNHMMQELMSKMSGQERDWQKMLDKLLVEMDSKLDRLELDPVKQLLEDRWKALRQQLKERPPLYQADEAAAMRKQLLAHFHCLSCDRPLETPVTGQIIPVIPMGPGLPGHRSIRPYTVFELEQVRQQSRNLKLGCAPFPRGDLAHTERSVGRLRTMHSKMLMDIEKVQIHFGGSVKASSQMIRELLQAQCLSSPCHRRVPDMADYTYSSAPRRCGGSHTLTYPYRRNRLQHLSQGLYPTEEIQIAMKHDEVDILGLDGHIYKGRIDSRLPGIPSKDTPVSASGMTKHKAKQPRPHTHRQQSLSDSSQLPSRPQSAQMLAGNNSAPSHQRKDRPVSSEGLLSQPNVAHPPSPSEMGNRPADVDAHLDVPPGEGLEEPTRGPRSTTAH
ncbi:glutamine-rich protein 2 isoform X2 [Leopardus geoffroyi]|uniref:glutamine-rich protein 2 isoform X2 n=1 Tax=Leopardus geoffroyi TaxID=46844 RepID=UPI001E264324|nr:glutamine-rich protein 2 isoform X2 [Leopardus geoffroyi]